MVCAAKYEDEKLLAKHFGWTKLEISDCGLVGVSPDSCRTEIVPMPSKNVDDCGRLINKMIYEGYTFSSNQDFSLGFRTIRTEFSKGSVRGYYHGTNFPQSVTRAAAEAICQAEFGC